MDDDGDNRPLVEPEIISCVYLSGAKTWEDGAVVRFVGWTDEDGESRVRIRYAIPLSVWRALHRKNGDVLSPRGH